jgi:hypothetical protein
MICVKNLMPTAVCGFAPTNLVGAVGIFEYGVIVEHTAEGRVCALMSGFFQFFIFSDPSLTFDKRHWYDSMSVYRMCHPLA